MNRIQKNYPAIDLGDYTNRVCVQVTAQNSSAKIQKTIDKFVEKGLSEDFDRLIILIITEKKNYTKEFGTEYTFAFDSANDIWDIDDLLGFIEGIEIEKAEDLKTYLAKEVKPVFASLAEPDSIFAQAEKQVDLPPKTAKAFLEFLQFDEDDDYREDEFESIRELYSKLTKLSKNSREYLAFIVQRAEKYFDYGKEQFGIAPKELDNMLANIGKDDVRAYFQILETANLASIERDEYPLLVKVHFSMASGTDFFVALKDYCKTEDKLRLVLVEGDFTVLD
jgi:hypothetical protein